MQEENCARLGCDCEIDDAAAVTRDGKSYCSEFCASSEGASLEDCECGHDDCD